MGLSRAFLAFLFSGVLGKGRPGIHRGGGLGQGLVPGLGWRTGRELAEVKRDGEILGHWESEAEGSGLSGQPGLCKNLSQKARGRGI